MPAVEQLAAVLWRATPGHTLRNGTARIEFSESGKSRPKSLQSRETSGDRNRDRIGNSAGTGVVLACGFEVGGEKLRRAET